MSQALKTVPKASKIDTGVSDASGIAEGLIAAVADTHCLLFKTQAYHWNVEGPLFHSIHVLTEAQYNDLFAANDVIAERVRALGKLAPHQMGELAKLSCVKDLKSLPSAQEMVEDLVADHEAIAKRLRDVIALAEEGDDPVTADLLTARCAFHEKAAWMLRATAK
ncbi:DNA starvation/stationary phase protection protein [Pseudorhodobacter sp. E13]|uniref:Dps family protein n=1 Tax=Pseudorhodobacter sp. E13 TaxID=2487931 RepID=UPI000F8EB1CA|nr:DNA starvation/stationary phase protection protein [Pseudorhodobacter sp. E13]RUS59345.1 DNA starvation/stationary phase protection protein [Pseudorhodobacter sp. E13]